MTKKLASIVFAAMLAAVFALTAATPSASAQLELDDLFNQGGPGGAGGDPKFDYKLQANSLKAGEFAVLSVVVELPIDHYTYSMQDENSATRIKFDEVGGLEPIGDFKADRKPKVVTNAELGWTSEKYFDQVTWVRHYRITDPADAKLAGKISGSFCTETADGGGSCLPFDDTFAVNIAVTEDTLPEPPVVKAAAKRPFEIQVTPVRKEGGRPDPLSLKFSLSPQDASPGETVVLSVQMDLEDKWHTFSQLMEGPGGRPTILKATGNGLTSVDSNFTPDHEPHLSKVDLGGGLESEQSQFEGSVTWTQKFVVNDGVAPGDYGVDGLIKYQVCKTACLRPWPIEFGLGAVSTTTAAAETPEVDTAKPVVQLAEVDSPQKIAEMATLYDVDQPISFTKLGDAAAVKTTFLTAIIGAFIGGVILNLMPCVFPVLGIKVMGFVQLAGNDPKKIRMHGLAFTAGLVVSMWCLAGVILFIKLWTGEAVNWGQQMGNAYFVGGIIILLFVLGLNMAGVFEMGTSMTRVGGSLHQKKGYSQSFFSGILTTLIATPCSGPFLGAAMGYTLAQSAIVSLFLFTIFALGIALPYLLLSFFPALINKLPRPGAWMEVFKVTMAFALFATAAFFMQTFGGQTGVNGMSWLTMALVVIGLALYFYGQWGLPHLSFATRFWKGFVLPVAILAGGLWMAWGAAEYKAARPPKIASEGEWQQWQPGKPEYLTGKKKRIVFVDYTADW